MTRATRNQPASNRRRNKKIASANSKSAKDQSQLSVSVSRMPTARQARASEVILAVGESLELKTASETRHHTMPTPAELEAEGWKKFYRDPRYAGTWMMMRKL